MFGIGVGNNIFDTGLAFKADLINARPYVTVAKVRTLSLGIKMTAVENIDYNDVTFSFKNKADTLIIYVYDCKTAARKMSRILTAAVYLH